METMASKSHTQHPYMLTQRSHPWRLSFKNKNYQHISVHLLISLLLVMTKKLVRAGLSLGRGTVGEQWFVGRYYVVAI